MPLPAGAIAVGTGFFIAPDKVMTSAHVIAGSDSIVVENRRLEQARAAAQVKSCDAVVLTVQAVAPSVLALAEDKETLARSRMPAMDGCGQVSAPVRACGTLGG